MKGWKETLRKYRLSIWICVLSYPAYWLIVSLVELIRRLLSYSFPNFFFMIGNYFFVWVMGTFFFLALVFALDTFAKDRKE